MPIAFRERVATIPSIMGNQTKKSVGTTPRGILARPLDALIFLLPLIVFYELGTSRQHEQVVASVLLQQFVRLFGDSGMWVPAVAVVAILLATHIASKEPWVIHLREVGFMYIEAVVMAVPLVLLNLAIPRIPLGWLSGSLVNRAALGVGAGVYEELVFRLILLSLIILVGTDLLKIRVSLVAAIGFFLSSLTFAAYHHQPIGPEPFDATKFLFRAAAGLYLSIVFWYRGYGPAAGCHAAYNAALVTWEWL